MINNGIVIDKPIAQITHPRFNQNSWPGPAYHSVGRDKDFSLYCGVGVDIHDGRFPIYVDIGDNIGQEPRPDRKIDVYGAKLDLPTGDKKNQILEKLWKMRKIRSDEGSILREFR